MAKRIDRCLDIFHQFRTANCSKGVAQKPNLDQSSQEGLRSLQARVMSDEIPIIQTDKSGKFGACTPDIYLTMGEKHNRNDL